MPGNEKFPPDTIFEAVLAQSLHLTVSSLDQYSRTSPQELHL